MAVNCVNVEGKDLQADISLGNLASALTLHTEEAALVAELQAGSEQAFSWLINRYHQPIYSLLARTVRDPADAADLTQDVFVKIFRGIGSFHSESSLRTWIYRIALHEASNQRRWWEVDMTYLALKVFVLLGLAWNVQLPERSPYSQPIRP